MFSNRTGSGSLRTLKRQPRDSTTCLLQAKLDATSGRHSRRAGFTSTTSGPEPVNSRKSGMCRLTTPSTRAAIKNGCATILETDRSKSASRSQAGGTSPNRQSTAAVPFGGSPAIV